jgi:hypothetical protein
MKRPQRQQPTGNELRPASAPEQSALAIQAEQIENANNIIERLTAEVSRLEKDARTAPDLKVEAVLYAALCHERALNKRLREKLEKSHDSFRNFRTNHLLKQSKLRPKAAQ